MPTPIQVGACGTDVDRDSMGDSGKRRGFAPGHDSREVPPAKSNVEEACHERSMPQDVTSSVIRRGGVNLHQEVEPHVTERPPRDFIRKVTTAAEWAVK